MIRAVGIGNAGCRAISRVSQAGPRGVDCIAVDSDACSVEMSAVKTRIQIGRTTTKGRGAGGVPAVGRQAAEEDGECVMRALEGADVVLVIAGMGGGAGTGAAPLVAQTAKRLGALTIGIVTTPLTIEGPRRLANSERGIARFTEVADILVVLPGHLLPLMLDPAASVTEIFRFSDEMLLLAGLALLGLSSH